ncbi:aminodeoxychorismate synthase component I [endosymbiont of Lamellibrachia barhami]|uniref:aminodeoxychorismate synthase component I n=1 Tax=endosymbiont of Lamellibrachia barhami TaxID=205975 RepID=UPI0015AAD516|nr:aminodeoxychorismate synthase component I [endosymbiont of Lamellibrachia barhami]
MTLRIQRLPYCKDSARLFESIRDLPWPVFLDSAYPMTSQGRYDILAADPTVRLVTRGEKTEILTRNDSTVSSQDPLQLLYRYLAPKQQPPDTDLPFTGGAIGWFSYDLARRFEKLPVLAEDTDGLPEMVIGIYDWAVVIDHQAENSWLVGQGRDAATGENWDRLVDELSRPSNVTSEPFHVTDIRSNLTESAYHDAFQRIQRYIREGDCYQVNFAQRFDAEVQGAPWEVYKRLRKVNPAPFCAYLESPYAAILSSSPERFLHLTGRHVETCPIKGTAPRHENPGADRLSLVKLKNSEKDRAENLMIVDLLRNDIGKVCATGSVEVSRLFEIESFARVHHLVSTVEGELADGENALTLLRACFPGGSITGAPKLRAMEIIEELEPQRRGVYCGAIGYIGFNGDMDTNIAIRTLLQRGNTLQFSAGGGIIADSTAEAEYQETYDKAAALFELLKDPLTNHDQ